MEQIIVPEADRPGMVEHVLHLVDESRVASGDGGGGVVVPG